MWKTLRFSPLFHMDFHTTPSFKSGPFGAQALF